MQSLYVENAMVEICRVRPISLWAAARIEIDRGFPNQCVKKYLSSYWFKILSHDV